MERKEQPEIEMYTLDWCPYCEKAKAFLRSKGFSFKEYYIDEDEKTKEEMKERTDGAKTVPQIFIDDKLVGGYDDLTEMNSSGELNDLLGIEGEDYFDKLWELVIIGAGPAALNAALYGARKGLDILIIAADMGGQMLDTGEIDNYLGKQNTKGADLIQSFWEHVKAYDVKLQLGEKVNNVYKDEEEIVIETKRGNKTKAKAAIIATGARNRELRVEGEKQLKGKGVHYCATCDGYLYAGEPVAVVGGGNAGLEAGLDLANLGCEVDLVEVQDGLTGDKVLRDKVTANDSIKVHTGTGVEEIKGKEKVDSVVVKEKETDKPTELDVSAVFVEIGLIPNSKFVKNTVKLNEVNEIVIDDNNQTSVEGIWAAGDVTDIRDKQIIIAAAEGAKAALRANEYLSG